MVEVKKDARGYRTTMYSVNPDGTIVRHQFPFNAEEPLGMLKLQKFVDRGFTFEKPAVIITPEVVTNVPEVKQRVLKRKLTRKKRVKKEVANA